MKILKYDDFTRKSNPGTCLDIETGKSIRGNRQDHITDPMLAKQKQIKTPPKDWQGTIIDAMKWPGLTPFNAVWSTVHPGRLTDDERHTIVMALAYKLESPPLYQHLEKLLAGEPSDYILSSTHERLFAYAMNDQYSYKLLINDLKYAPYITHREIFDTVVEALSELRKL